jgi:hypothetical protein
LLNLLKSIKTQKQHRSLMSLLSQAVNIRKSGAVFSRSF